jgi:hypothetical protein
LRNFILRPYFSHDRNSVGEYQAFDVHKTGLALCSGPGYQIQSSRSSKVVPCLYTYRKGKYAVGMPFELFYLLNPCPIPVVVIFLFT